MRVAIVGSREYPDWQTVIDYVNALPDGDTVISGGARGVDRVAENAARKRGLTVISFEADWDTHGKKAGFIRNVEIVNAADRVVAFWANSSAGTADTIDRARKAGKPVEVHYPDGKVETFNADGQERLL